MTNIQALVLGTVQGITEFFPVSSSGHLILVPYLMGWQLQPLSFDVALHLGTTLAVLLFFWKDWYEMIVAFFMDLHSIIISKNFVFQTLRRETKMLLYIFAACIPVGIAGILLQDFIESTFRSALYVGIMFIAIGIVMYFADRFAKSNSESLEKDISNISFKKILMISSSQILALFPGTSRSGITISTALFNKVDYAAAAKISFLLATPLILAAGVLEIPHMFNSDVGTTQLLIGFVTSFLVGMLCIKFLLGILKRYGLMIFIIYRIIVGIIIISLSGVL
jgi:undecaprenyl-diphosphatase